MKQIIFGLIVLLVSSIGYSQLSNQNAIEYFKAESIGGKLDFYKKLEEQGQTNKLHLYDGIAYNSKGYSILLWGQAAKRLGIPKFKDAKKLWESIYESEMSKPELKALKKGYNLKVEE